MRPVEDDKVPCAKQTRQLTEITSIVTSYILRLSTVSRTSDDLATSYLTPIQSRVFSKDNFAQENDGI
jgi:hypothetical protein